MMIAKKWTATENRVIEPFARSLNALSALQFRLTPEKGFSSQDSYWVDPDEIPAPFRPEILLRIDKEILEHETHLSVDDLRLVVVARDRALHLWEVLDSFVWEEIPDSFAVDDHQMTHYAIPVHWGLTALVTPRYALPETTGRAHDPRHVVAEKAFEVRVRREGPRFPIHPRSEDWFQNRGYPVTTVWTIDWKRPEAGANPLEALDIVVNERYEEAFRRAMGGESHRAGLPEQIATEIFAEVAYIALRDADEWLDDPESLLGTVVSSLGVTKENFSAYKDLVTDPSEALPKLRANAQSTLSLGSAFGNSKR